MDRSPDRIAFVRDVAIATATLATVYLLAPRLQWTVLVLPYYLLVGGFDLLELLFEPASTYRSVLVGGYLLALGAVGAAVARGVRVAVRRVDGSERVDRSGRVHHSGRSDESGLGLALAAPFVVLGLLALLLAASVLVGTDQREPVWTAGIAGLTLLAVGGLLASLVGGISRFRRRVRSQDR